MSATNTLPPTMFPKVTGTRFSTKTPTVMPAARRRVQRPNQGVWEEEHVGDRVFEADGDECGDRENDL